MSSPASLLLVLALQVQPSPPELTLLEVETRPREVHTGDRFELVLRVRGPDGFRTTFPDSLPGAEGHASAGTGSIRFVPGEVPGEGDGVGPANSGIMEVVYPLQWFRPGRHRLPPIRVLLEVPAEGEGERRAHGSGEWRFLSPGFLSVLPVLPRDREAPEPLGPVQIDPLERAIPRELPAVAGALGVFLLGLGFRASRGRGDGETAPPVGSGEGPRAPSPSEAALKLKALFREGPGLMEVRWEEALLLFRVAVQPDGTRGAASRTTWEILSARPEGSTSRGVGLRWILEEGDRMRFAPEEADPRRRSLLIHGMREWMEANGV